MFCLPPAFLPFSSSLQAACTLTIDSQPRLTFCIVWPCVSRLAQPRTAVVMSELLLQARCPQGPRAWPWRWIYGDINKALKICMWQMHERISVWNLPSQNLSAVTFPTRSQRSLFCFKIMFLCLTWVFPLRALLSWHYGTDPSNSLYMALSGFRLISQGPSRSSLKHFVILLRENLCIYISGFPAQKHAGHFEKCVNAFIGVYLVWIPVDDCNRHPPWRCEI